MKTILSDQISPLLRVLLQFALLVGLSEGGNWFVAYVGLPIPGAVIGMLALLLMLSTGLVRLQQIENAADLFVKHLSFFFIPIAVGLMAYDDLLYTSGLALLLVVVLSVVVGMGVTGHLCQWLLHRVSARVNEVMP